MSYEVVEILPWRCNSDIVRLVESKNFKYSSQDLSQLDKNLPPKNYKQSNRYAYELVWQSYMFKRRSDYTRLVKWH
jgi:hypothetical protein